MRTCHVGFFKLGGEARAARNAQAGGASQAERESESMPRSERERPLRLAKRRLFIKPCPSEVWNPGSHLVSTRGASIVRRKSAEPWRGSRRVLQSESGWTQPALGWARGSRPKAQAAMGKPGFWIPMPCAHLEDTSARSACSAGLIRLDRSTEFNNYAGRISLELAIGPSPFQLGTCTVRSPR